MQGPAHELILHHYDPSPFAEKVRLVFGHKRLTWRSVIQPMVLPKPDLIPLTGGNRRMPVLQIGADVFCGTAVIAVELERRFPDPSVFPTGSRGLVEIVSLWADQVLFTPSSNYAVRDPSNFPDSFYRDRAEMRGHAPIDRQHLAVEASHHLEQLQIQLGYLETVLADGRAYIFGQSPSLADFATFARVWWAQLFGGDQGELASFPRVAAWTRRIAGIGHGERREMMPAEALEIARMAEPNSSGSWTTPSSIRPGDRVSMATEGHGPDPVEGVIVAVTAESVALRREDPDLGAVTVHLPRQGYAIRRLEAAA